MRWFCHSSSSSFADKSTPPVAAAAVSASPPPPPSPPPLSASVASSPPLPPPPSLSASVASSPPVAPPPLSASVASSPTVAPPPLSAPTTTTATAAAETSSSSQDDTPRSRSTVLSPSTSTSTATTIIDLSREYTKAVQTSSYAEIWDKLHEFPASSSSHLLDQLLHPDHQSIHQALQSARPPSHLTRLVSAYFDTSEHTSKLCLLLQRSVDSARRIYAPLHDLLEFLPPNSPAFSSHSQLDWAFSSLSDFDLHDNPFPSDANFHDMRLCFSGLKLQLDRRLRKARHRVRVARRTTRCYAICLIGTAVGVTVSAVLVATHALAAIVAVPFLTFLPSTRFANQQLEHIAQLDAAARGTYVLNNDLDTIDRLVARLHATVESDKLLVRLGLQRGKEAYAIQEVLKQLRKNQPNFLHQLKDLEEHVCLCFAAVNRARSLLVQQIHLYQTRSSDPQPHFCFDKFSSSDSLTSDN